MSSAHIQVLPGSAAQLCEFMCCHLQRLSSLEKLTDFSHLAYYTNTSHRHGGYLVKMRPEAARRLVAAALLVFAFADKRCIVSRITLCISCTRLPGTRRSPRRSMRTYRIDSSLVVVSTETIDRQIARNVPSVLRTCWPSTTSLYAITSCLPGMPALFLKCTSFHLMLIPSHRP